MQCEFLVDIKYCTHPEAAFFTTAEEVKIEIEQKGDGVSTKTAKVKFKCKGQDNCEIYKSLQLIKQTEENKS